MKNLTTAIFSKKAGSSFNTLIGGRLYKGIAPDNPTFPYSVYQIVSNNPEKTFSEDYENTLMQFSFFSNSPSSEEIEDIYTALKALYDECSLTITGSTLVWMRRINAVLQVEEHTTSNGMEKVWAYYVDYEIKTSLD